MRNLQTDAIQIINQAIEAVKPEKLIPSNVKIIDHQLVIRNNHQFNLSNYHHLYVIGFGKASAHMGQIIESILSKYITSGLIITKYDHAVKCRKIKIEEAGHPVTDNNGLLATEKLLQLLKRVDENDLVICLISGGGSALFELLPPSVSLLDWQTTTQLLLKAGADITEVNTIRKHLSLVKGGKLARTIYPATGISLIISDVIGDALDVIASGPTVPDTSTNQDVVQVINKYQINKKLPSSVLNYLLNPDNQASKTPKANDPIFEKIHNFIIGNNQIAAKTAQNQAQKLGYQTSIIDYRIKGDVREVATRIASKIKEIHQHKPLNEPVCLIAGGETTVTVKGHGKGGRNQELALTAMLAMKNYPGEYLIASCGTDGTDGPTDAAGGFASHQVFQKALKQNLNPQKYLNDNDSYNFLAQCGGLIKTCPTGTNVMDIIVALIV